MVKINNKLINTENIKSSIMQNIENINDSDANNMLGRLIIAYGNNVSNRPSGAGNGFLINLPHTTSPELYNKQFWLVRDTSDWYIRNQTNGVWSNWNKLN